MMTVFRESLDTDMELLEEELLDETKEEAKKILFVCTGNTCRSPMAEVVFNFDYYDSGYIAESAGIFADGSPMSDNAVTALEDDGYRVRERHISRSLTDELVKSSDIIVGISSSHAMQIIMNYPEAAGKVYAMPFDITDPYGGGIEIYKACLSDIKKALAIVAESL